MVAFERATGAIRAVVLGLSVSLFLPGAAMADTEADNAKLAQCAKDICAIIVSKKANGPDLNCDLAKTWEKDQIQKGAESKNVVWGLGSAKCTAKVKAKRSELIAAVTAPEITFKLDRQSVACEIGTERYELRATMVPELKGGETVLTGLLEDRSAVFGVLGQIEALGLELVELRRVRGGPKSPESSDAASPGEL